MHSVCDQCVGQEFIQAHMRRNNPYGEICDYCFSENLPTIEVSELAEMFGTILEELFEITSLKDGVGVNGRIPPGVALPDLYANLLNAERSVESVLVEHLLCQFSLNWDWDPDWDVDDDLNPEKIWYSWRDGVIPGAGGIWELIEQKLPRLL